MVSASAVIATALRAAFSFSTPIRDPGGYALTVARHAAIVDAIEAQDAEAAGQAMRTVIEEGRARVLGPPIKYLHFSMEQPYYVSGEK